MIFYLTRRSISHFFLSAALGVSSSIAFAAGDTPSTPPVDPPQITIIRQPGKEDGVAQMTVKGKVHKITPHALQAWPVRNGQGALILVVARKEHEPEQYILRYYDLDSGRRRALGAVPVRSGTVLETTTSDEQWAFSLSGQDATTNQNVVLVGDEQAVPGVLEGAGSPTFSGDNLLFSVDNKKRTLKVADLLGTDLGGIYSAPPNSAGSFEYLQLFPNGTAMVEAKDGVVTKGRWQTDGTTLALQIGVTKLSVPQASLQSIKGIPAGTRFSVRLIQPLSSRTAKEGMTVSAINITPLVVNGEILIPEGSSISGTVTKANGVGWGFKHETASLTIDWNKASLADGGTLPMTARVFEVENAQEKTTDAGKIQGIRSTATPGNSVENGVLTFAGIDPIAYIFASAAGSAVLGFAEPEILYNAGTELVLEYTRPLITVQSYPPTVQPSAASTEARQQMQDFVKTLPFRTRTKGSNKVSDLTNLVFIGDPEALHRAFLAAGWLPTDDLNSASTFRTLKTLSGNQTYTQAPMSILLLDERAPLFALSKTTNTFASRHHVRVFPTEEKLNGVVVVTASSTQDTGISFSRKQKTFIHVIDQHLDNERSKIINDLTFTGCVENVDMIPRPWLPTDAFNSTGDRLLTDRQAAVLHINACTNPKTTPSTVALPPNRFERVTRDTSLTIRNNFYRGNLIYQGIAGGFAVRNYLRSSNELPEDYGAWRKTDSSGAHYAQLKSTGGVTDSTFGLNRRRRPAPGDLDTDPQDIAAMQKVKASHKWDPPRYEFALEGGYLHFRETDLSFVDIFLTSQENPTFYELDLFDQVNDGWAAGGTVTVNSWKHFSNEFSYFRQQGKYTLAVGTYEQNPADPNDPGNDDDELFASTRVGLTTRQFEYNLLAQLRPPTSRWRPYIAVGPTFQLISLAGAPLKRPAGVFTLGLKNVGLIKAAFEFGNTPPLDGGGIFQFGLQYGAGIKYRATPHIMLRADYRETWSQNPNIIKNSYEDYEEILGADDTYTSDVYTIKPAQKFFQDRFTLGIGFAF